MKSQNKELEEKTVLENIQAHEVEIPYVQRIFANIIDWLIEVACVIAFYLLIPGDFVSELFESIPYLKYLIAFLIIFGYRLISILLFGRTIGMMLFRIKYLNENLLALTSKEKLIVAFAIRTKKIKQYKNA